MAVIGSSRSRTRLIGIVAVATAFAAACGGSSSPDTGGEAAATGGLVDTEVQQVEGDPVYGGAVVVGTEADVASMLPGEAIFSDGSFNQFLAVYDTLFERD